MNLNEKPTIQELAKLFAARKDSLDSHILWICNAGEVHIEGMGACTAESEFEQRKPNMRARLKMYRRGQGYVGKKAAADTQYIGRVLATLEQEWPTLREGRGIQVIDRLC